MVHGGQCLERHIQWTKKQWEKNQRKRRENKRRKNNRINEWREKAAEERMDEMDLVEWPVGESGNGNWNEEFSLPDLGHLVEDTAEDNRKGKKGDSKRGSGTLEITLNKGMQEIHAREVILVGGRMDREIRVVESVTSSTLSPIPTSPVTPPPCSPPTVCSPPPPTPTVCSPPPPQGYFTAKDIRDYESDLIEGELGDFRKASGLILREVLIEGEMIEESDMVWEQLEKLVKESIRIVRNREDVVDLLKGIELTTRTQKDHILKKCREKMEELLKRGLLTNGRHSGNNRGVRRCHDIYFGRFAAQATKFRETAEFYKIINIRSVKTMVALAKMLFIVHLQFFDM